MNLARTFFCGILFLGFCCLSSAAPRSSATDAPNPVSLMDRMTGNWVLQGVIANKQTTHDVQVRWVLNREYIELHEVSREKDASGKPAYEAIVYLSWDAKTQEYTCMWLDSTAGGGLSAEALAHGKPAPDAIPVLFALSLTDKIHTTFRYDSNSDTWRWTIDNDTNGKITRFADVKLTRAK